MFFIEKSKRIKHFEERLTVVKNKFFYLNEIIEAEKLIKTTILKLLKRNDHKTRVDNLDKYLEGEADQLSAKITNFDRDQFINERTKLVEGCIKKSFFVITGKPGTGKTQALKKVIEELQKEGQGWHILAPTGKASLRLKTATGDPNAKTIDRQIYSTGDYRKILEDFEGFSSNIHLGDSYIHNLIIDESSMLDLKKFAVLLKI